MKKIIVIIFLAAITGAVAIRPAFCQTERQDGVIRELTGDVELKHAGTSVFVSASSGDTVASGTIVSTGFKSTAIIAVGSSVIIVRPLTRLTLAEIQTMGNTENASVNLQAGRVRVDVNPPAGMRANFNVQSPIATASVRGTSFEMDAETLTVSEGRIIYSGTAGPAAIVTGGNTGFIDIDGRPANPAEVAETSFAPLSPIGAPVTDNGVNVNTDYNNEH
jgi:hypothetical protein